VEVTFLGTGAPLAPTRCATGLLVTAPGCAPLLIDTCGGFEVARQIVAAGFALTDIGNVIVTHRHMDHAGGVPALLLANLPLTLYASDDTHAGLDALVAATYPEWPPVAGRERVTVAGGERREIGGFAVAFVAVTHRVPTLAVRVTAGGSTLAFSADGLPDAAMRDCARNADLFVCDALCAERDGERWAAQARTLMHPTAREAATLAREAGAKALALVHLARFADAENVRAEAQEAFPGPVSVPDDLARLAV